jgi:hypothetical protein
MSSRRKEMNIEELKKRYKEEWLLVKITITDEQDRPIEGEVLLHSKNRDEIYEAQKNLKEYLYITYSGEMPKKGFAVAFNG